MASIELELTVVAVHGEGDRDTVNSLAQYRKDLELRRLGTMASEAVKATPDEPPDVIVVLRDEYHHTRFELPITDWDEVEKWKELAGWDAEKRHWQQGAKVKVSICG